jgi:mono/diheme cytochrome c family protein
MKTLMVGAYALALALAGAATSTHLKAQSASDSAVERGRYLVSIMACHDCHSPKIPGTMKPDPERMLSGRPPTTKMPSRAEGEVHASEDLTVWRGGWGQSVASNLTPDPETGIGRRYNEAKFVQTMRSGKKPEGTALRPPMPVDVYQNVKDDDLKAIYAYLRTIKPIKNGVYAGLPSPASPAAGGRQ